ncbi:fimbrial biogenesis outer membrane usher protein [Buttiauxella sp. B2]|uniref:fimbria/pilus outer membrane usher protein n=1 Tax=Buttiauxella sp. B2 TaxID=2587812 RepID=UPI001120B213|nr:fimbria/pilus outer membrane usher protein [Buttiauxella sp. B2]TNV11214.1 fimbrial biogenesis outer membrane usher protein [Buttiauxella sp. B2]
MRNTCRHFSLTPVAWIISILLAGVSYNVEAREYFNPELLEADNPGSGKADLTAFEDGAQAPGKYHVDIIINDQLVDTRDIDFSLTKNDKGNDILTPCLKVELLKTWGVKTDLFPELKASGDCANLAAIPQASSDFLFNSQRLVLSIPQSALSSTVRGYVAPEFWDQGINAFLLNYSLSGANTSARGSAGSNSNSQYANLRPGLNVGQWRFRNYSTWNRDTTGQDKWSSVYTYAQRSVIRLKSLLTLGDSSSPSDVFDSIPFRGAQLASDDDMLPSSLQGYAPVVRGIARTNAQVIIRQNGYIIYQTYVAPGAFEINDMYATGGSGDLNVTIKEADGSEQYLVVPFASLPVLQREGRLKYSLTAGQYRSYNSSVDKAALMQGTAIYGLPHGFTLYGGVQGSGNYQSLAFGTGKNMGDIGAVSIDVTQAKSTLNGGDKSTGQSWRVRYSKNITQTGTNFSIAGYRYSTNGFYGMAEVLDGYGDISEQQERRRNRAELSLSQSLGESLGSVTLSAVHEDYWNIDKTMKSYSATYGNGWHGISWSMGYSYNLNSTASGSQGQGKIYNRDQIVTLNVNIPLDKFLSNSWASYNLSTSKQGGTTHNVGLSGEMLEGNALNWAVQQGYGDKGQGNTGNINADYHGSYAQMSGGYAYDKNSQRMNYGLSGGVLAHANGVTFAQPFGESIALIKAPGASGVSVQNQAGVKTDFRGYTVVSNLSPYRKNDLTLNTENIPDNVDLELTTKTVVPTRGAVVRADYKANIGLRVLMTLHRANGQSIPFGATASVGTDSHAGGFIVGDDGQVYLTGLSESGTVNVQWGKDTNQRCSAPYQIKANDNSSGIITSNNLCG